MRRLSGISKSIGPELIAQFFMHCVERCLYHAARIPSKYHTKTVALMDGTKQQLQYFALHLELGI